MGILNLLPQGLITLLEWLVMFIAASAMILIIAVGIGQLLGNVAEDILGWVK